MYYVLVSSGKTSTADFELVVCTAFDLGTEWEGDWVSRDPFQSRFYSALDRSTDTYEWQALTFAR